MFKNIKTQKKTFIIAEIGSNHNQSISNAYKLINIAKKSGADAVKFQFLNYKKMYLDQKKNYKFKNFFKSIELKEEWIPLLNNYCKKKNIIFFFSSCFIDALDTAKKNKIKLTKIASPQFYSFPEIIRESLKRKLFTICSTGYSTFNEIKNVFNNEKLFGNKNILLMHCLSKYPAKLNDINLDYIKKLKKIFKVKVGYSDHTMSTIIPAIAVLNGAICIEKHLTYSRKARGPDHSFALEPDEFKQMVKNIREIEIIKQNKNFVEKKDLKTRENFDLKLFLNSNVSKGEVIDLKKLLTLRSNLEAIKFKEFKKIKGAKKLKINKKKFDALKWKDLKIMY